MSSITDSKSSLQQLCYLVRVCKNTPPPRQRKPADGSIIEWLSALTSLCYHGGSSMLTVPQGSTKYDSSINHPLLKAKIESLGVKAKLKAWE